MNKTTILTLAVTTLAGVAQAQVTNLNFTNFSEDFDHTGRFGGPGSASFRISQSGTAIETGDVTTGGISNAGGLLIAKDQSVNEKGITNGFQRVNLNNNDFTFSGSFSEFDSVNSESRLDRTFFGLTNGSDAETLYGGGMSVNPGYTYYAGSLAKNTEGRYRVVSRRYLNGVGFAQSLADTPTSPSPWSEEVDFTVNIAYNGLGTLSINTTLQDTVTPSNTLTTTRTFNNVSANDVSDLRFFFYFTGRTNPSEGFGGALLENSSITLTPTPEPSSTSLIAIGATALLWRRKRK